ncbi:MAG: hypothetical protein IKA99_01565 [Clostridia bacterium]|nr:hypothetical protein [Clostridia bacterium]
MIITRICVYFNNLNRQERKKTIILCGVLLFFLCGMGISIIAAGLKDPDNLGGLIPGILMVALFVMIIAMMPSAFKQYPIKRVPLITVKPKEITINGETFKQSDVKEVRLTITLAPVGNKEENEKHLNSILDKEPMAGVTANLDFAVPGPKGKVKTVYTTIENGYEALVTLYQAGYKHYSIVYSMKKLAKKATYDLGQTKTEDGKTLSSLSKKERLKQLF